MTHPVSSASGSNQTRQVSPPSTRPPQPQPAKPTALDVQDKVTLTSTNGGRGGGK